MHIGYQATIHTHTQNTHIYIYTIILYKRRYNRLKKALQIVLG